MLDQTDTDYPTSVRGIITGKTEYATSRCNDPRYPAARGCNRGFTIPSYKVVPGCCSFTVPGGCSNTTVGVELLEGFIERASDKTPYVFTDGSGATHTYTYDFGDWLSSGGAFIWDYSVSDTTNSGSVGLAPVNDAVKFFGNISKYFSLGPIDKCAGKDCSEYGTCADGTCICGFGTSGSNCEVMPLCESAAAEVKMATNKAPRRAGTLVIGVILIVLALGSMFLYRYTPYVLIPLVIGLGLGIFFTVRSSGSSDSNPNSKVYYYDGVKCVGAESCPEIATCYSSAEECAKESEPKSTNYYCRDGSCIGPDPTCPDDKCYAESTCGGTNCRADPPAADKYQCRGNSCTKVTNCDASSTCYSESTCGGTNCRADPPACVNRTEAGQTKCVPCRANYSWKVSDWSKCSEGAQTRSVSCTDSKGNVADESKCAASEPASRRQCVKEFYSGDGQASYTYYSAGESPNLGSCGGCGSVDSTGTRSYEELSKKLSSVQGDAPWTMAAATTGMMGGTSGTCCAKSLGMCCKGRSSVGEGSKTANAPCGSCWQVSEGDKKLNVVVADACPCGPPCGEEGSDNSRWCAAKPDVANSVGKYNHFDLWNGNKYGFENGTMNFKNVECPSEVKQLMKSSCCDVYWTGQGCQNICGEEYTCP